MQSVQSNPPFCTMFKTPKHFAYVGLLMGTLFALFGITVFVKPAIVDGILPQDSQNIFGFILIIYGGFRIYRSYLMLKAKEE